jgi:hypothetical protein
MARPKKADIATFAIKRKLEDILRENGGGPGQPLVVNHSKSGKEVVKIARGPVVTVRQNIVRIQEQADPFGFLIAVQTGALIPVSFVNEEGEVETIYQATPLKERIAVAKYLAAKIMPTLSITKHVVDEGSGEEDDRGAFDPARPGQPSFAQVVNMAASKRRASTVIEVVEEDGGQTEACGADGTDQPGEPPAG